MLERTPDSQLPPQRWVWLQKPPDTAVRITKQAQATLACPFYFRSTALCAGPSGCAAPVTGWWHRRSLAEVPRGRALDGLLLPDGAQPLGPGRQHGSPLLLRCVLGGEADLSGQDSEPAEVQGAMLPPQREGTEG